MQNVKIILFFSNFKICTLCLSYSKIFDVYVLETLKSPKSFCDYGPRGVSENIVLRGVSNSSSPSQAQYTPPTPTRHNSTVELRRVGGVN